MKQQHFAAVLIVLISYGFDCAMSAALTSSTQTSELATPLARSGEPHGGVTGVYTSSKADDLNDTELLTSTPAKASENTSKFDPNGREPTQKKPLSTMVTVGISVGVGVLVMFIVVGIAAVCCCCGNSVETLPTTVARGHEMKPSLLGISQGGSGSQRRYWIAQPLPALPDDSVYESMQHYEEIPADSDYARLGSHLKQQKLFDNGDNTVFEYEPIAKFDATKSTLLSQDRTYVQLPRLPNGIHTLPSNQQRVSSSLDSPVYNDTDGRLPSYLAVVPESR